MSVERTQSSQSDNRTRDVDKPRDRPNDKVREEPKAEVVDRFRTLMQNRGEGKQQGLDGLDSRLSLADLGQAEGQGEADAARAATDQTVLRKGRDSSDGSDSGQQSGGDGMQPAELAALHQAHVLAREVPATPPPAAPLGNANAQALADMLERHVRQLAISPGGTNAENCQVLLRLSDSTLPGTDLLLTRTDTGWLLRADVRSRGSYDAIQQAAPQLAERFASRNLGTLEIDPHFSG